MRRGTHVDMFCVKIFSREEHCGKVGVVAAVGGFPFCRVGCSLRQCSF